MTQTFTWNNFISLREGNILQQKMFKVIIIICVCLLIFIVNWVVSWKAGGYLTTAGAILSFFLHLFGFYAVWNSSTFSQLLYIICLGCVCLLYVANAVLSLLTITLNYEQEDSNYSQELAPVFYFQLNGIAGGEGAQLALFIILVVINLGVIFLTFSILVFVIQIRRLLLAGMRASSIDLGDSPIEKKRFEHRLSKIDYNIPGITKITTEKNHTKLLDENENGNGPEVEV